MCTGVRRWGPDARAVGELRGESVVLRPTAAADAGDLRALLATPEVARWIDVFLDPALHGRGLGTDAVATLVRHLVEERGHHRVTIDPAADNAGAIRSYEKAGFRAVGTMRRAWRDPWSGEWRDTLFMEHVAP